MIAERSRFWTRGLVCVGCGWWRIFVVQICAVLCSFGEFLHTTGSRNLRTEANLAPSANLRFEPNFGLVGTCAWFSLLIPVLARSGNGNCVGISDVVEVVLIILEKAVLPGHLYIRPEYQIGDAAIRSRRRPENAIRIWVREKERLLSSRAGHRQRWPAPRLE
jgi:hypothetical protein